MGGVVVGGLAESWSDGGSGMGGVWSSVVGWRVGETEWVKDIRMGKDDLMMIT